MRTGGINKQRHHITNQMLQLPELKIQGYDHRLICVLRRSNFAAVIFVENIFKQAFLTIPGVCNRQTDFRKLVTAVELFQEVQFLSASTYSAKSVRLYKSY